MEVRERTETDLDGLVQIAGVVHDVDGYPLYLPGDLRTFLASADATHAWVAEMDGEVVGHVALHHRSSCAVMALASEAAGRPPERLGVIARLLVAPPARGKGIGRCLLRTATDAARGQGLYPVLDVAVHHAAAIKLYEASGWERAGRVTVTFGHGGALDEYVYLGPSENP